nr:hypothetical protein [Tanacetum cinerariifolium]
MAQQVARLITRWWDVPDLEIDSYENWKIWMVNLRMSSKNKKMLEGRICYLLSCARSRLVVVFYCVLIRIRYLLVRIWRSFVYPSGREGLTSGDSVIIVITRMLVHGKTNCRHRYKNLVCHTHKLIQAYHHLSNVAFEVWVREMNHLKSSSDSLIHSRHSVFMENQRLRAEIVGLRGKGTSRAI